MKSNEDLQKKLNELSAECLKVFKTIRAHAQEIENEVLDAEGHSVQSLHEALREKMRFFHSQDTQVSELRSMCSSMERELKETDATVSFLEHYRDIEQDHFAKQIQALKLQVEQEGVDFQENVRDVQRRFERSKNMFLGELQEKLASAHEVVSTFALRRQSIKDKVTRIEPPKENRKLLRNQKYDRQD